MAISWGAYEGHLRVGLQVTWRDNATNGAITNATTQAEAVVEVFTGVDNWDFDDDQTLSYSGSISGSTGFHNGQGANTTVERATRTYVYTYGSTSYGSSPGTRTFTASLSGAYNGATPSKSVTSSIPARPIAAPVAPSNFSVSRISDTSTKVSWTRNATSGKPYETLTVQRSLNGGGWTTVSTPSGTATSYTQTSAANEKAYFQVRANNDAGSSAYVGGATYTIYTSPALPGAPSRTEIAGPAQRITWTNKATGYTEYQTEILGYKNGVYVGVLGTDTTSTLGATRTFDHTSSNAVSAYTTGDKWKYTVRHKTTSGVQGTLYSAETDFTSETAGVTVPPLAPTNLSPDDGKYDPTKSITFSWKHNPGTDSAPQTAFKFYHRLVGAGSWTEVAVTSGTSSYTMAANTYPSVSNIEWKVATKGTDAAYSPDSDTYAVTLEVVIQYPVVLNGNTGELEALTPGALSGAADMAIFTSSGTFTKASYPGGKSARIRVLGGGGQGGGTEAAASGQHSKGGGGGAGGYSESIIDFDDLPDSVTVTVGGGGSSAGTAATGQAGGASSFGTLVVANGGAGGSTATSTATTAGVFGGLGGSLTGAVGQLCSAGSPGDFGFGSGNFGHGGSGGSSVLGGGGRGAMHNSSGSSSSGVVGSYGGGGGGAFTSATGSAAVGGAGGSGIILVEILY